MTLESSGNQNRNIYQIISDLSQIAFGNLPLHKIRAKEVSGLEFGAI